MTRLSAPGRVCAALPIDASERGTAVLPGFQTFNVEHKADAFARGGLFGINSCCQDRHATVVGINACTPTPLTAAARWNAGWTCDFSLRGFLRGKVGPGGRPSTTLDRV